MNSKPLICCFGEMLWDVLPEGRVPGGAPMNVALHLKNLGVEVALISKVGKDTRGEEIKNFFVTRKCSDHWIQLDSNYPTGTVIANVQDPKNVTYDIVSPAAWDFIDIENETVEMAKTAHAFIFGTLACRNDHSRATLLHLLKSTNALKIFDVNFRHPHYSKELVQTLLGKSDIVKMNNEELEIINTWFDLRNSSFEKKMERLKDKFKLKRVLVTRGAEGATMLDDSGFHTSPVYKVDVKDTIGSGDAFLAGIIKNILLKAPPEKMLKYACAMGSLVATHKGATPEITEKEVFELIK